MPLALRKLPQCFGITNTKKGDFPHGMNCKEYQDYSGPMPPKEMWKSNRMSDEERKHFEEWHQTKVEEQYTFDFKDELIEYCKNDVDVLRLCMNAFQKEPLDPFIRSITVPSACMSVLRTHFLENRTIAILDNNTKITPHSTKSIYWLLHKEMTDGGTIQHARNGKEVRVGNFLVDGYCQQTETKYEFYGCFWHGCSDCYGRQTINSRNGINMGEINDRTYDRLEKLQKLGKTVIHIWEHD